MPDAPGAGLQCSKKLAALGISKTTTTGHLPQMDARHPIHLYQAGAAVGYGHIPTQQDVTPINTMKCMDHGDELWPVRDVPQR